jgi:hypothetical protein
MDDSETPQATDAGETGAGTPALEISSSRQFPAWLAERQISLPLTTYQVGKLFLIGLKPDGQLSIFERSFNRFMGLCNATNGLYLSSLYQVWRFENVFTAGEQQRLRPALRAAGRLHHRRPRHPRPRRRRRWPAGLRQHPLWLPGEALGDAQLQALRFQPSLRRRAGDRLPGGRQVVTDMVEIDEECSFSFCGMRAAGASAPKSTIARCSGSEQPRHTTSAERVKGRISGPRVPCRKTCSATSIWPYRVCQWTFFFLPLHARLLRHLFFLPLRLPSRPAAQRFVAQLPQFLRHPPLRLRRLLDITGRVLDHRQQRLDLDPELGMISQPIFQTPTWLESPLHFRPLF